jgi:hypothetical protein
MKKVAILSLLSLSASAAVVKRQFGLGSMGMNGFEGLFGFGVLPGIGGLPALGGLPGLGGFDITKIAKSLPKGGLAGLMRPVVRKANKIEYITPLRHPDAKRIRLTYGPYKIKAANVS